MLMTYDERELIRLYEVTLNNFFFFAWWDWTGYRQLQPFGFSTNFCPLFRSQSTGVLFCKFSEQLGLLFNKSFFFWKVVVVMQVSTEAPSFLFELFYDGTESKVLQCYVGKSHYLTSNTEQAVNSEVNILTRNRLQILGSQSRYILKSADIFGHMTTLFVHTNFKTNQIFQQKG